MKKNRFIALVAAFGICSAVTAQNVITLDQLDKKQQAQPQHQQAYKERKTNYSSVSDNEGFGTFYAQYNIASMKMSYDGHSSSTSLNGVTLGYNHAAPIIDSTPLYLEFGAAAQYFFKTEDGSKFNMISAKVPVSVLYGIEVADGISLDPFAGLYARVNIWGQEKYGDESIDIFKKWEDGGMGAKRFQFGLQIGLRARFNNKFTVGVSYAQDLNEFMEHTKINSVDLTIGVNF